MKKLFCFLKKWLIMSSYWNNRCQAASTCLAHSRLSKSLCKEPQTSHYKYANKSMSNKKPSHGLHALDPPRKHNKDVGLKLALEGTAWVEEFQQGWILGRSHLWTPPLKGMRGKSQQRNQLPWSWHTSPACCYHSSFGTQKTIPHHLELRDMFSGQNGQASDSLANQQQADWTKEWGLNKIWWWWCSR